MGLPDIRPSTLAWCAIAVGVAGYDLSCLPGETLSEAADRALERPVGKVLALGAIALTASHLANLLPEQIDPFYHALKWKQHGVHERS